MGPHHGGLHLRCERSHWHRTAPATLASGFVVATLRRSRGLLLTIEVSDNIIGIGFQLEMSSDLRVVPSLMGSSFGIVELLANEARSMRLSEIADALELPRSGTHRVLTMLCGLGWLEQDPRSELYRLSLKLSILGHRF